MVHNDALSEASEYDLRDECEYRRVTVINDLDEAIDYVEQRGFIVLEDNAILKMWDEVYTQALTMDRDRFMIWLNGQFIRYLEKWI